MTVFVSGLLNLGGFELRTFWEKSGGEALRMFGLDGVLGQEVELG